jgi:hypothetical protein
LLDIPLFVFVSSVAGFIVSMISYKWFQKNHKKKLINK